MKRQKILGWIAMATVAVVLVATGCGGDDTGEPADADDTTTSMPAAPITTTPPETAPPETAPLETAPLEGLSSDTLFPDGLRGRRYCEVLLLSQEDEAYRADVYNTLGLTECPQEEWETLDAAAIAEERGALVALLNGPRYWTLDEIVQLEERERVETTFGTLPMFLAATVDLGDTLPEQTPYTERHVVRETIFRFDAGTEVHELTAPDGRRYVMQSLSHIVDDTLSLETLAGLGERLDLPEGWTFASRTLDETLDVLSADGVATVVQDDLQNTYQRIEETER